MNTISLLWGVPGILVQTFGSMLLPLANDPLTALMGLFLFTAGTALLLVGLAYYAKAKGHSYLWGLAGILSCVGILILAFLPDRIPDREAVPAIEDLDIPDGRQSPFGTKRTGQQGTKN